MAAPADDRGVVGDRQHPLGRMPDVMLAAVVAELALDRAAEADLVGDLGALELPGIAERQPVLRLLDLPAVVEQLPEQAVLIADAVAEAGDPDRRHALHEAGGEPAEAAVAERGVGLDLAHPVEIDVEPGERRPAGLVELQIAEILAQQAADQELEREVVDPLLAARVDVRGWSSIQRSTAWSRTASAVATYQSWSCACATSLPTA